jgi:hypothetical protein
MSRFGPVSILLLALLGGCGGPTSKVEDFKKAQENTVTPHGKIDLGSVKEAPDGDILYKTTDGSGWKVSMDYTADGQPRFGEPVKQGHRTL